MSKKLPKLTAAAFFGACLLAASTIQATAQTQSPEEVAHQAGSVKGTAAGCAIDTSQYDSRVKALFAHMATEGASASKLEGIFQEAALESEHLQRSAPSVGCNDFRGLFGEFGINSPEWTPSHGWKPL
jgi:hypothetical protein